MEYPSSEQLTQDIAELVSQMSDPDVSRDVQRMKQLTREHADKESLLELTTRYETLQREQVEAAELAEGSDADMATMAQDDLERIAGELTTTTAEIEKLLIPRDPRDDRDVILEIRAGAGGEESALFAAELFRAYTRYGELHDWKTHLVSSSKSEQGGFKEVVAEISGDPSTSSGLGPFGVLKFERGVHRVQRIPETEKQGRVHTSTVTVAVLPQAEEVDLEIKTEDLRIDTYRASGAGGQHVNKTSSAIRITHVPTNTVVAVQDERSQHKNKEKALRILRSRLLEAQVEEHQKEEAAARKEQVGTGDRSEKIRTYNFPQDRITDHRIKKSWSNIPAVMNGELEQVFADLQEADRALSLKSAK